MFAMFAGVYMFKCEVYIQYRGTCIIPLSGACFCKTQIPSDRLLLPVTGCWVLDAGWMGGGISRAAAHRLCGGRSWQLLGHGRWLRGRMGLPGLAVFDLQWRRRRKGLLGDHSLTFPSFFPFQLSILSHRHHTLQGC